MSIFNNSNPSDHHVHFIGIGGIGMCGLAEIMLKQGFKVSGSDRSTTLITQRLQQLGAHIIEQHDAECLKQVHAVVYSSAISEQNSELLAARARGLPLLRRGQLLAELMMKKQGIAIAGTHGKTTTTGMISYVLTQTTLDPITINGGIVQGGDTTIHFGQGNYLVAEADESDQSFLLLKPEIAVITNIEADHLENYAGDFKQLQQSFISFANTVPEHGVIICGIDDPLIRQLIPQFKRKVITFGFSEDADIRGYQFKQTKLQASFSVVSPGLESDLSWTLSIPGRHNVQNALATIAVAQHLKIEESVLRKQLQVFPGMGRRFHFCGQLPVEMDTTEAALVYTDYGHHPSELAMTVAAARAAWPGQRLLMVFQPHRYSRTAAMMDQFAQVLAQVDIVVLLDIYAAYEAPIPGVTSKTLGDLLSREGGIVYYLPEITQLFARLRQILQANDIIFLQGAGNIGTDGLSHLSEHFI